MTPDEPAFHESITLAKHGRAYAAVHIIQREDRLYRFGVDMRYAHGGFSFPVGEEGFPTLDEAKIAGIKAILRQMHKPHPSDPMSVREELSQITRQLQDQIRQPSLF